MAYFETEDYEIQKNHVTRLLSDFYYATGTPVWLYTHASSILISVPEEQKPSAITTDFIQMVSAREDTCEQCQGGSYCIATPVISLQGLFGFLYVELPDDTDRNVISGIKRFLKLTEHEIVQNNLIILQYQRYVDQFKASLWDILDTDLSVPSLCNMLGVSKTKLTSDFKKYAGTTIAKFILNIRIEKARELLTTTGLSVTEISAKVGFNDYNYFCRVFRKYNGLSPKNYRVQNVL